MTTKIEAYNQKKDFVERITRFSKSINQESCDKLGARVKLVDAYYGFYGNSSCSTWGTDIVCAVEGVLVQLLRSAINTATREAGEAMERARLDAAQEAQEILQETHLPEKEIDNESQREGISNV